MAVRSAGGHVREHADTDDHCERRPGDTHHAHGAPRPEPRALQAGRRSQNDGDAGPIVCGALAYVGGSDTERILGWAAPVVYVLIGRAIEAYWPVLRRHPVATAALAIVQLLSARVFWPVPVGYDNPQPLPADGSHVVVAAMNEKAPERDWRHVTLDRRRPVAWRQGRDRDGVA